MKQKMIVIFSMLTSFTIFLGLYVNVQGATVITSNQTGTIDDYNYELWHDSSSGSTSMTLNGGGTFNCSWSNAGNVLFTTGKIFNKTQTHQQLGNISVNYDCNYQPNGNSYLGVYGWTTDALVEYYIVESWGTWKPPGNIQSKGTITVDDGTYDIYLVSRPSISIVAKPLQYWSVRTTKRTKGTVSVSQHFKAWESLGMKLGKMYEVSLLVEGYQSSGKADVTSMSIDIEPDHIRYGDLNSDGQVDSTDCSKLKRHLVGITELSQVELKCADLNMDGVINSTDYAILRRFILGIIEKIPLNSATPILE